MLRFHITKKLPAFTLDIALEASAGVTGMLGPSGAGKTTLLDCIAGLAKPDAGRIELMGETLFEAATGINRAPERRRLGYVFQDPRLFPHMSVAANLDYGQAAAGAIKRDDMIDLLDLAPLLDRRPHHLSGGEKRRVAIGRALLSNPRALLLDEPLSHLDPGRRYEIMPFLESLHRQLALPILYVSHQMDEILRLSDRVVVMRAGRSVAAGGVEEVMNRRDVQTLILGQAAREADLGSFVDARLDRQDTAYGLTEFIIEGGRLTVPHVDKPVGAHVRLRIRARDVSLALAPPAGLSIQNCLQARVTQLLPVGPAQAPAQWDIELRLVAAAGALPLYARITRRAADAMALEPGKPVWALIKSVALASDWDAD